MPLLLALIAILLVGGGAYVYTQNKQANQSISAQISYWKTYTNSQYGFEFKYPDINARLKTVGGWTDSNEPRIIFRTPFNYNECVLAGEGPTGGNGSMVTIAGREYCLITMSGVKPGTFSSTYEYISHIGNEDIGIIFSFSGNRAGKQQVNEEAQSLFNQSLSTLKLTSSTAQTSDSQTANWKKYTNTKDSYSFRYPSEWSIDDAGFFSKQGVSSWKDGFFSSFFASDLYVLIHSPESTNATRSASPQEVMSHDYPSNRGVKKEEWLHINGIPVLYYDTTSDTLPDGPNGDIRFVIFTSKKQYVFVLSPGNKVSPTSFVPGDSNIMKKIISTFSLLNSSDKFVDMTSIPLSTFQMETTPYQPYRPTIQ